MLDKGVLFVVVFGIVTIGIVIFLTEGKKIMKTVNKPIDIIQKKNADNDLDKKLERLQKLGQLLKEGVITKEEFEKQKKKIEL
jgi:hypothetical protein